MAIPHILILGTGSVGRRHARNLMQLGARVSCFDPRADRLQQATSEIPALANTYDDLGQALAEPTQFHGVVVASPPRFHVEQAELCLRRGLPVLLEKPVSPGLDEAVRLEKVVAETNVPLLLGYTYRWWPPLMAMKERLREVGPLRHARFVMSAHLADWHPWENYQDFFMASRELGGGALLDESHFIDLMQWLFGKPEALTGRVEHLSSLEITTDDNVDLLCIYKNNFRVTIHLDLYGRPHDKSVTVVGEDGTLQCLFDPNMLRYSQESAGNWAITEFDCERNDMFLAEAREFLRVIAGDVPPSCTIKDGVEVLRCVEAARQSTESGQTVGWGDS